MSEQENIDVLAEQCQSADDYAALALKIASNDPDRAKTLLKEAELKSQFPADYISTAAGYIALADQDYATDLIDQAEEACFEVMEYAAVGRAWGELIGNTEKASELLQQAVSEVQTMPDMLTLANTASASGADELAGSLYKQIEDSCKTIDDYAELASTLLRSEQQTAARKLFTNAGRLCDDIASTVIYAKAARDLFHDPKLQRGILEEAEADCQFPAEFVQLATGFHELLDDTAKVEELLEQGEEFAFSGAEYLDLANGYLQLKKDKVAAAAAYQKALPETNDRLQLQQMARTAVCDLGDANLAKTIYAKLEQRSQNISDRLSLVQAVLDDTGDKDYALDLYQRIEEKLTTPRDLTDLATAIIKNLDDKPRAVGILNKALHNCSGFQNLNNLFDSAVTIVNDKKTSQAILGKWAATAESTAELLLIYQSQSAVSEAADQARDMLLAAEDRISSLGEMKNVATVVARDFAEDKAWQQRLEDKLKRREANQSTYTAFQDREKKAILGLQLIRLGHAVMRQLEDEYYCRKLLNTAQTTLQDKPLDLYVNEQLMNVVVDDLQDRSLAADLLGQWADRCQTLTQISQLMDMSLRILGDLDLASKLLHNHTEPLSSAQQNSGELLQLATVVWQKLRDQKWVEQLLQTANDKASTLFDRITAGNLARQADLQELAKNTYAQAAASCQNANDFNQLYRLLCESGLSADTIKSYYALGTRAIHSATDKLHWAEGIIDLTGDRQWAQSEYHDLASELKDGPAAKLFYNSQRQRLHGQL